MQSKKYRIIASLVLLAVIFALLTLKRDNLLTFLVPFVFAHCDTMEGPVIQAAKKALETGNIDLVLIWVQKENEAEIKKAFQKTLTERKLNPQADMRFFGTLVRIHRAGEGEPYTGIKPAGTEVEPGIAAADKAIENGSVEELAKEISGAVATGIKKRFQEVTEKKKHMNESVEAGRAYVRAYVEFIHYVEKLHQDISGGTGHHEH